MARVAAADPVRRRLRLVLNGKRAFQSRCARARIEKLDRQGVSDCRVDWRHVRSASGAYARTDIGGKMGAARGIPPRRAPMALFHRVAPRSRLSHVAHNSRDVTPRSSTVLATPNGLEQPVFLLFLLGSSSLTKMQSLAIHSVFPPTRFLFFNPLFRREFSSLATKERRGLSVDNPSRFSFHFFLG